MKNLLTTPLVLLALLAPLNASADVGKGMAAYEAEDYATMLQNEAYMELGPTLRVSHHLRMSIMDLVERAPARRCAANVPD